jgi:hypothetical protein
VLWDSLEPRTTVLVDTALAAEQPELDFVAQLRAGPAQIVFVIEHKSYPDPGLVRQLIRDTVGSWLETDAARLDAPQPAVVPLVVHHGPQTWALPRGTRGMLGIADPELAAELSAATLSLQPAFDDLAIRTEAEILARPLRRLALLMLQFLRGTDPGSAEAACDRRASPWVEVQATDHSGLALETVGSYALEVTDLTAERLRAMTQRNLGHGAGEVVMGTAEKLRAEGRKEARKEARKEGKAELLPLHLQHRFGPLPEAVVETLRTRTESDLDRIGERRLDARSLDGALGA